METALSSHGHLWELIHSLPICHHIYERSILFGYELPLCCRCTGIYSLIPVGFVLNYFLKIGRDGSVLVLVIIMGLAVLTGVEALFEHFFELDPGNLMRLATGAVSGFSIGVMFNLGISGLFEKSAEGRDP